MRLSVILWVIRRRVVGVSIKGIGIFNVELFSRTCGFLLWIVKRESVGGL